MPYKIRTVLTDNGVQFCDLPQHRSGPTAHYRVRKFDRVRLAHGVEHRYGRHQQLSQHLAAFVLDAPKQAIHDRRPAQGGGPIRHSDRGNQGRLDRSSHKLNQTASEQPGADKCPAGHPVISQLAHFQ